MVGVGTVSVVTSVRPPYALSFNATHNRCRSEIISQKHFTYAHNIRCVMLCYVMLSFSGPVQFSAGSGVAQCGLVQLIVRLKGSCTADLCAE